MAAAEFLRRTAAVGVLALALAVSWSAASAWAGEALEGIFPDGVEAGYILRFEALPAELRRQKMLFRLDAEGRPTLLAGRTLILLGDDADSLRLPGTAPIGDFAWMRDGAFLAVSGKRLATPEDGGYRDLFALPDSGMRIEPADENRLYLHGGDSRDQRLNLYIFRKGGRLMHLAEMPYPITAVSGDGVTTFAAVGRSIMVVSPGKPVSLVFRSRHEVKSLAKAPPWGLFYATRFDVGYVRRAGQGFAFLKGRDIQLSVAGEDLYLLIPGKGILKASPVSAFEDMADSLYK